MVELKNIDYAIGGNQILQDVSLTVGGKETLAILGASGSGKSTILKVILGLAKPDRGEVMIQGQDISLVTYSELVDIRKKIGIVFQDGALFDSITVGENVGYYFMEHKNLSHEEVEPLVLEMLDTVGLKHTLDMMPDELSGGMRRRVAIARALIYKPSLILYDEPTTGLDPVAKDSILELIDKLKEEHNVASVIVTHDLDDAYQAADRFVVIRNGQVVWGGTRRQFAAQRDKMIAKYFCAPYKAVC
ncbi:ATP-binding cassette domain-containing protein [candidate division FCPU426 bacterium]|nr:ATP-binding cassette domain-containing protein [candidate division FCPU426 bacterium]